MGSNIYPEDIETVLYRDPRSAARMHSFMLSVVDDETGTPRPAVALELSDLDGVDDAWRAAAAERLRDGLEALNIDYRSSLGEFPGAMLPIVSTYADRRAARSPATPAASSSGGSAAGRPTSVPQQAPQGGLDPVLEVPPIAASARALRDASRASASE